MSSSRIESATTRRELLRRAGLGVAILAAPSSVLLGAGDIATTGRRRALRIAHLTDIHLKPELQAPEWLAACLHHLQEHHKPDLVLVGGDTIFDSMEAEEGQTRKLWELSQRVWKAECSVPVEACIGNHDIWGINKAGSKTTGSEPMYGKRWVMDIYGWQKPYRSFDRGGWHFVALDSVMVKDGDYLGKLDDEQFEWLREDLARVSRQTPVLLFSHIPVLSAAVFFNGDNEKQGNWNVPASRMMIDSRRFKSLFREHPNVKLCLSGHLHMVDRVDYLGVSYLCNGAVSGAWWNGKNQEFDPGYGLIDLFSDGSFENRYVSYGWKPAAAG